MPKKAERKKRQKNQSPPTSANVLSFDLPGTEFIFGIVAPVGTDTNGVISVFETALKKYRYTPKTIRISNFLDELDLGIALSDESEYLRSKLTWTPGMRHAADRAEMISWLWRQLQRLAGHAR